MFCRCLGNGQTNEEMFHIIIYNIVPHDNKSSTSNEVVARAVTHIRG